MRPASACLAAFYGLVTVAHVALLEPPLEALMVTVSSLTASAFFFCFLFSRRVSRERVHDLTLFLAAVTLANPVVHLYASGEVAQTATLTVFLIGAGTVVLRTAALAVLSVLTTALWIVWCLSAQPSQAAHWAFILAMSVVVCALAHVTRRASLAQRADLHEQRSLEAERTAAALDEAEDARRRLHRALEAASEGLWEWNPQVQESTYSDRWLEITGLARDEIEDRDWVSFVHPGDRPLVLSALADIQAKRTDTFDCTHRIGTPRADYRWVRSRALATRSDDSLLLTGSVSDATETTHHQLTGLLRKRAFRVIVDGALNSRPSPVRVLCIGTKGLQSRHRDVDPVAADELTLRIVAAVQRVLRSADTLAQGEDSGGRQRLYVLAGDPTSEKAVERLARDISSSLQSDARLAASEVHCFVGVASAVSPEATAGELLLYSSVAADVAAEENLGFRLFEREMLRTVGLERSLRKALEKDSRELSVAYQRIVDAKSGRTVALEALARWHSEEWGTISPKDFIPIAEQTGLIDRLDVKIAALAVAEVHHLLPHLTLQVNISPATLCQRRFVGNLTRALADWPGVLNDIVLEVTESAPPPDVAAMSRNMRELSQLGASFAIDDFGIGYSGLSTLRNTQFSMLKIDRSFLFGNASSRDLLESIVKMGLGHELVLVAEGIERHDQIDSLRELGCHRLQGFAIHRPTPIQRLSLEDAEASYYESATGALNLAAIQEAS